MQIELENVINVLKSLIIGTPASYADFLIKTTDKHALHSCMLYLLWNIHKAAVVEETTTSSGFLRKCHAHALTRHEIHCHSIARFPCPNRTSSTHYSDENHLHLNNPS